MKKYQKLAINIAVLTFLLTGGISPVYALSFEKKYGFENNPKSKLEFVLLKTFEQNDYKNWKKYIGVNSVLAKNISQENFNKFVEIRSLARNGKTDLALKESEEFEAEIKQILKNDSKNISSKIVKTLNDIKTIKKAAEKSLT